MVGGGCSEGLMSFKVVVGWWRVGCVLRCAVVVGCGVSLLCDGIGGGGVMRRGVL